MSPAVICLRCSSRVAVLTTVALALMSPGEPGGALLAQERFDLVLAGGRVMDPESGYDRMAFVGIRGGSIAAVSEEALAGDEIVDVSGLVVAPGFIDLHAHGQSREAQRYRARDGVTTALELEWGYPDVGAFLRSRRGRSLIHYGASVAHGLVRSIVMLDDGERAEAEALVAEVSAAPEPLQADADLLQEGFYQPLDPRSFGELRRRIEEQLEAGGLGIGMAHAYYPGVGRDEIFEVFELAAERRVPIYSHVRGGGLEGMQEVIANAAATGAPLHIVHVNSSSGDQLPVVLEMIAGARRHGVDLSAESYPYTAGSTSIESSLFDEGWQERMGISYGDLQWQDTGERLTEETFRKYRREGGVVIIHDQKEELIRLALATPFVMVASDAMPYAPGAHPRSAGTFARVLGRYVRELEVLSLMEALRKATILPAQRLESVAPTMKRKGRITSGADADITVFDPARVRDTATYTSGPAFSEGIVHVLVNGVFVVRDESLRDELSPGRAVVPQAAR